MLSLATLSFYFNKPTILALLNFVNAINIEYMEKDIDEKQTDTLTTIIKQETGENNSKEESNAIINRKDSIVKGLLGKGKDRVIFSRISKNTTKLKQKLDNATVSPTSVSELLQAPQASFDPPNAQNRAATLLQSLHESARGPTTFLLTLTTWKMDSRSSPNPTASTRWAYVPLKPSLLSNKEPVALLYPMQPTQGPYDLLQTSRLPHNGLTAHQREGSALNKSQTTS
jgi:hypothetical protein